MYDQHPELIAITNDLAVIQQRSGEEIDRIVNTLSNEVEIARSQEASLEKTSDQSEGRSMAGADDRGGRLAPAHARGGSQPQHYEVVLNRVQGNRRTG